MRALKQAIRTRKRQQRRQLTHAEQLHFAQKITHRLSQQLFFKQAQHIGLYLPFDGEVSTLPLLKQALLLHKSCYAPILANARLQFIKIDSQTPMVKNRFGILEPSYPMMKVMPASLLDVVLVPLVAFDKNCQRLGMGAGFYDTTFAFRRRSITPLLIGLAYDFQKIFSVPRNELDLKLDGVVSEKCFYT
jgi:5-formyltetrahydrofolate cyclo-ligase